MNRSEISKLGDGELIKRVEIINNREHSATVELVLHLIEVEERELFLGLGYPNLFSYCRERLGYSEPGAYRRITAARAIRDYPEIYELLDRKEVSLTTLALFAGILTPENKEDVLSRVRNSSRAEVEIVVASYKAPKVVRDSVKPIVERRAAPRETAPIFRTEVPVNPPTEPTVPYPIETKFKVQFSVGSSFMKKLKRIKELRGQEEFEKLFEVLMDSYLERKDPIRREEKRSQKAKEPKSSNPEVRYIPVGIKDSILKRDSHQCSFVSPEGKRCCATAHLQIDHKTPFALGGHSTVDNLRVLCAAHNRYAATQVFGQEFMQKFLHR